MRPRGNLRKGGLLSLTKGGDTKVKASAIQLLRKVRIEHSVAIILGRCEPGAGGELWLVGGETQSKTWRAGRVNFVYSVGRYLRWLMIQGIGGKHMLLLIWDSYNRLPWMERLAARQWERIPGSPRDNAERTKFGDRIRLSPQIVGF